MPKEMKYDFGDQLISGKALASARATWWPRHCRGVGRYLAIFGGKGFDAVREAIGVDSAEWEKILPEEARESLMGRHSALEMTLVDAARAKDLRRIDTVGRMLLENAERQSTVYGTTIKEFPAGAYKRLLAEHVLLFTKSVRLRMEGAKDSAVEDAERSNTLALAAFTAEWF